MQTAHQNPGHRSWREKILNLFKITGQPSLKIYNGYGHDGWLTIFGHAFKLSPFPRNKYKKGVFRNTIALLRLFIVKPYRGIKVQMTWKGKVCEAKTETDGFFKFDWKDEPPYEKGWIKIEMKAFKNDKLIAIGTGNIFIPEVNQYIFISDIDDTFLISHSSNLRKRLFVLFTNNARSRQPFEGVVKHYQLLQYSGTSEDAPNPFFYVSSSEWNLYDYLLEFKANNEIPKGVYLLSQLKLFSELLKTGQNNHYTKFARIVRIMEAYPKQRVVLLGDSSQHDPYIYQSIVQHFPKQVHAVYIRDIYNKSRNVVADVLEQIESAGVPCCFFKHSSEAILHSIKIGLIPASEVDAIESPEVISEQVEIEKVAEVK